MRPWCFAGSSAGTGGAREAASGGSFRLLAEGPAAANSAGGPGLQERRRVGLVPSDSSELELEYDTRLADVRFIHSSSSSHTETASFNLIV